MGKQNGNFGMGKMTGGKIKGKPKIGGTINEILNINNLTTLVLGLAVLMGVPISLAIIYTSSDNPTPTPSPTPTSTPSPFPSPFPSPTPTSTPSPFPSPFPSPTPTIVPSPSLTDEIKNFRAKLLDWHEGLNQDEKKARSMRNKLRTDLDNLIYRINELSESLFLNDIQKARAKFYVSYWLDFKRRALNRNLTECVRASSLYSDSINLYLEYLKNGGEIQTEEIFFIIIELAHWLANRDARGYNISGHEKADEPELAAGFDTALKLLSYLEKSLESFDHLKGDFYATRGVIYFNKSDYKKAISDFKKAFNYGNQSIELKYNIASAYFFYDNYEDAIKLYEELLKSSNNKIASDALNKNLGFAYLLEGYNADLEKNLNGTNGKPYYEQAKMTLSIISDPEIIVLAGKVIVNYLLETTDLREGNLTEEEKEKEKQAYWKAREQLQRIINTNIGQETLRMLDNKSLNLDSGVGRLNLVLLKKNKTGNYITHDEIATKKDDLFKIFHDDFYCDSGDRRINNIR